MTGNESENRGFRVLRRIALAALFLLLPSLGLTAPPGIINLRSPVGSRPDTQTEAASGLCTGDCMRLRNDAIPKPIDVLLNDGYAIEELTDQERLTYNGVGLFYARRGLNSEENDRIFGSSTGSVIRLPSGEEYLVTSAHQFVGNNCLKRDLRLFRFGLGNIEAGEQEEFRVTDVRFGTLDVDGEPHLDFAIARLDRRVPGNIRAFQIDRTPQSPIREPTATDPLIAFHSDIGRPFRAQKSPGEFYPTPSLEEFQLRNQALRRMITDPYTVVMSHSLMPKASGGVIPRPTGRPGENYLDVLAVRQAGRGSATSGTFDPRNRSNLGIRLSGNPNFLRLLDSMNRRGPRLPPVCPRTSN